jgi:ATP-dependent DNA ligase
MFRTPTRRALPLAFIPPCIPTWSRHAPVGRDRVHEIKHDGYRLMVRRQGARVRLFTRRGFDWSHRFPLIVEAAGSLRVISISIDGEAVVCGDDGISDFDRLHSQGWDSAVFLYAFDVLEIDGEARNKTLLFFAPRTRIGSPHFKILACFFWPPPHEHWLGRGRGRERPLLR